jgi:hypothetical protein
LPEEDDVMLSRNDGVTITLAAVATLAALGAVAFPSTAPAADESARFCCVANPRFAGVCKVALADDETCADVLAYLNSATSVGKTYCGTTPVRGGWREVECQPEEGED